MDYKKVQRSKEVATLEKTIEKIQHQQVDVQAVEQIEVKNVPLSSKVMLEKEDYINLLSAAQKYVVQVKKERKLEKLLQAAEKTIAGLKAKVAELTKTVSTLTRQLDEYVATFNEIKENDYNLNIPRYVDTFEEEPLVDIERVNANIIRLKAEIEEAEKQMDAYLKELGL